MFSKLEDKGKRLEEIKEEVDEEMHEQEAKLDNDVVMEDADKPDLSEQREEGTHVWNCEF